MNDPKTPWWAALFVPKKTGDKPATYKELVQKVEKLEDQLAATSREVAKYRRRTVERSRDNEDTIQKYRAVLEWYADLATYRPFGLAKLVRVLEDKGHRARKALGRI